MPTPTVTELTEQQARDLVAQRDGGIAERLNNAADPQSMIDLQVLINKRNEAYAQLAEMLRKQQALDRIIGNMH